MVRQRSRRGLIIAAAGAAAALLAGGTWWWAISDSVQVPDRTCGGVFSGKTVVALLPSQGKAYTEPPRTALDPGKATGGIWCSMTAGNGYVSAEYSWVTTEGAEIRARANNSIRLGDAKGYATQRAANLYLPCRRPSDTERSWLEVRIARFQPGLKYGDGPEQQREVALMAALVAEAAPHVTQQLKCEVAPASLLAHR